MRYFLLMIFSLFFILSNNASLHAFNFSFMENSPAYYFKGDDTRIMEETALKALDKGRPGEKISWSNPETGAHGYFIASRSYETEGSVCRNLKVFTDAEGVENEAIYRFCRVSGEWRIVD